MKLLNLTADKYIHFIAGAGVTTLAYLLLGKPVPAILAASTAGAAKEYWDSRGHGCVEWADFIATSLGGLAQGITFILIGGF